MMNFPTNRPVKNEMRADEVVVELGQNTFLASGENDFVYVVHDNEMRSEAVLRLGLS
jgi:hypothetical protein